MGVRGGIDPGRSGYVLDLRARDVAVVTPWYPTRQLPYRGAFVQAMVAATAPVCDHMTVFHCDHWCARVSPARQKRIDRAHEYLLRRDLRRGVTVGSASMAYIPAPTAPGRTFADSAVQLEQALRAALHGRSLETPVVHSHVGFYGGWAALRNAAPGSRVFVTEHATFLDRVLSEPAARDMYDELLHRCSGLFAVGEQIRALLAAEFPHHADRIGLIPNPIWFDEAPRAMPVRDLSRWLYVGGLIPRKGVQWLVEAFAICRAEDRGLTLTVVGDGELAKPLRARVEELGLADAVTFLGALAPAEALRQMREHDVLIHPSRLETFGVTVIEAVAAGMPVVVTRCGGPEETLAGIGDDAAEFIDVDDSAEPIVAGYQRLRARFPDGLNLPHARQVLEDRYGYAAVALAHERIWFPLGEPTGGKAGFAAMAGAGGD